MAGRCPWIDDAEDAVQHPGTLYLLYLASLQTQKQLRLLFFKPILHANCPSGCTQG